MTFVGNNILNIFYLIYTGGLLRPGRCSFVSFSLAFLSLPVIFLGSTPRDWQWPGLAAKGLILRINPCSYLCSYAIGLGGCQSLLTRVTSWPLLPIRAIASLLKRRLDER